jgi:rhodanese-related sulfurtransferase
MDKIRKSLLSSIIRILSILVITIFVSGLQFASQNKVSIKRVVEGLQHNRFAKALLNSENRIGIIPLGFCLQLFYSESALFIDIRPESQYLYEHIEGAVNAPDPSDEAFSKSFLELSSGKSAIVVYAAGNDNREVFAAAGKLRDRVGRRVKAYTGAWPGRLFCKQRIGQGFFLSIDYNSINAYERRDAG